MSLVAELKRRKVFKVGAAYVVIAWLVVQVASIALPAFEAPTWVLRVFILVLMLGFPIAVVMAWVFDATPDGLKRDTAPLGNRRVFGVALMLGVLALAWYFTGKEKGSDPFSGPSDSATTGLPLPEKGSDPFSPNQKSIAVLAFANLSEAAGNEYFADGISEELLNVLAKVPALKVAARTSAFHFKGKDTPIPEIARQLGVAYVVEGSVRRVGERVRITAQLISARDGFHVWSDSYDRDLKDVLALQDEIAGIIAKNLELKLGTSTRAATEVNPQAYGLVLEGRHFWLLRTTEGFDRAEAAYTRALALDPDFAQAHAALAELWAIRGWYRLLESKTGAPLDFTHARTHAQRAIALDPALAEPHAALGAALYMEFQYADAAREFEKALALNPNYASVYNWYGLLLSSRGDLAGALAALERATSLDPLSSIALNSQSALLTEAGRFDQALAAIERAKSLRQVIFVPDYGRSVLARVGLGKMDAAVEDARLIFRERERAPRWFSDADAIYALRQAGLHEEAMVHAQWAFAHWPEGGYQHGMILAALGRHDEAWPFLALAPPTPTRSFFYDSRWDAVRDTPPFKALIAKLGMTQEYAVARRNVERMRAQAAPP